MLGCTSVYVLGDGNGLLATQGGSDGLGARAHSSATTTEPQSSVLPRRSFVSERNGPSSCNTTVASARPTGPCIALPLFAFGLMMNALDYLKNKCPTSPHTKVRSGCSISLLKPVVRTRSEHCHPEFVGRALALVAFGVPMKGQVRATSGVSLCSTLVQA